MAISRRIRKFLDSFISLLIQYKFSQYYCKDSEFIIIAIKERIVMEIITLDQFMKNPMAPVLAPG